jgi:hypothetical protein
LFLPPPTETLCASLLCPIRATSHTHLNEQTQYSNKFTYRSLVSIYVFTRSRHYCLSWCSTANFLLFNIYFKDDIGTIDSIQRNYHKLFL